MTTREVMQQPTFTKRANGYDTRAIYTAAQTVERWNAFCANHSARRSMIKAKWNRYRRLCGIK